MSLNPPLPTPPRTPVRVRKKIIAEKRRQLEKLKKEQRRRKLLGEDVDGDADIRELPSMDSLVKSYLRRHEERMKSGVSPSQTRREEEYYSNLLLGRHANAKNGGGGGGGGNGTKSASSLHTAMGRKSALVENAYAFALRQQQNMIRNDALMTERESIEKVEELLRDETRSNRQMGRTTAEEIEEWSKGTAAVGGGVLGGDKDKSKGEAAGDDDDASTLPSILHDRPRAIRALNIWSARLSSTPYARWTIGAATALDHWIAREVLQMSEQAWQLVLEGGGTDAYHVASAKGIDADTLPGGESRRGLLDRMRDIVVVRGALFPETLVAPGSAGADAGAGVALRGDLDGDLLSSSGKGNATEKSIDELLASLGMDDDDDDDGTSWKFDDDDDNDKKGEDAKGEEDSDEIDDEKMSSIMDELQVWRGRNASSPYEAWDVDRKDEFDVSSN